GTHTRPRRRRARRSRPAALAQRASDPRTNRSRGCIPLCRTRLELETTDERAGLAAAFLFLKVPQTAADTRAMGYPERNHPYGLGSDPELELLREEREEPAERVETADPLKLYVRQLNRPLLTPAEERELARRKDEGDEGAKRHLIESNLRLVMSITRNYT